MAVTRRTSRPRFVLIVLVLLSATLITVDLRGGTSVHSARGKARDVFSPVQSAIDGLTRPITNFFNGVFEYSQLKTDNDRLRAQVAQLRTQQIQDQYLAQDNKDLTDLLQIDFVGDIPTVASRVIGGAASNYQMTIVIDRGAQAGVIAGMPVVAGGGLVGRVLDASADQSTVLLLTDPSMNVGVQFAPATAVGVVNGQGAGHPLSVTLIDPSQDVPVGTGAVTSGLAGSPYPRGIPVGKVSADVPQPGVHAHSVSVQPVVDLSRLTYVDVLLWTPQTHAGNVAPTPPTTTTTLPPTTTTVAK